MRVAFVVSGAALVSVAAAAAAGESHDRVLSRDPILDRPLTELLAYPVEEHDGIDVAIQQTLAQCRLHGVRGVVRAPPLAAVLSEGNEDGGSQDRDEATALPQQDVAFCHRVRFLRHARQRQRARETAIQQRITAANDEDEAEGAELSPRLTVDVRDAADIDFQTFFETYAERNAPVVLTQYPPPVISAESRTTEDDLEAFVNACFEPRDRISSLRVTEDECTQWLERFRVPLIAVGDYIPRTNFSSSPSLLPALVTVPEVSAKPVSRSGVACPFGLHTILQPLHGSVEYHLYDAQFLPFRMPPDDNLVDASYTEVSVSPDTGTSEKLAVFGGAASDHIELVEAMASDLLDVGQLLFVPGGSYFPVLNGASRILRFCYVDASNLNHVTETLRVDALVTELAKRLFLTFQSLSFDTSMARRPSSSDTLWTNYLMWPKETKLLKRRDMVSSEAVSGGSSDQPVPMSRRERLKLWQDDKRWERRVQTLTLPVPLPPVVMNTTRHSVTLRWQDLYKPPRNDITVFGYEVRWTRDDEVAGNPTHDEDGELIVRSGVVNFTHKAGLVRSAMPTTLFGDEFDGKDIEGVVRGLAPDATYSFTLRIFVGDNVGVESERSGSARTSSCSIPERVRGVVSIVNASATCVDLQWLAASDDGGRRITSYLFAMRYVDTRLASLQELGDRDELSGHERLSVLNMPAPNPLAKKTTSQWLFGSICDQIPGRVQIRVAAVNAVGVGAWSKLSEPMTMGSDKPAAIPTVRGRGDPGFLSSMSSLRIRSSESSTDHRPRVILSDVLQQVVVAAPGATSETRFDVWAGHYSPRRFHVSSELVLADPLDASLPLRNADSVRDRVVVIARGGVPFVFKLRHAQHAGALGVVFADVDDRCTLRGFDATCVPGATRRLGEGFGKSDRHSLWREIRIPFVLALAEHATMLLEITSP